MTPAAELKAHETPIAALHQSPVNPRKITRARLEQLARALDADRAMLWARPVIALPDGTVIAGNQRLAAAELLGWETIPAVCADLDEATARLWMLRDNQGYGEWDTPLLEDVVRSLAPAERDLAGFGPEEMQRLLEGEPTSGATDPDDVPEPPAKATARPGDVWLLGEHRLVCGDSQEPSTIAAALAGEQAAMVFTDPPYNVDYSTKSKAVSHKDWRAIEGDHQDDDGFRRLLEQAFSAMCEHTQPGGAAYVCHPDSGGDIFRAAYRAGGYDLKQVLIWVKQHFVLGRQDYQWQHEPILYGWRPGAAHRWYGAHTRTTVVDDEPAASEMTRDELLELVRELRNDRATSVIRENRPAASELHPTTKPVGLIERCVTASSRTGEIVLDPFAGSGSTLIAAERRGRRAALVELDPRYVDVICRRWADFTGGKPERQARAKRAAA